MISRMEMAKRNGLMAHHIMGNTVMGLSMEKEHLPGQMEVVTQERL